MKKQITNYHVSEQGVIRSAWLTYEDAKEFFDRLVSCFPDGDFDMFQENDLTGYSMWHGNNIIECRSWHLY